MTQCSYKIKYFDYDQKKPIDFECKENGSNSGLCVFHDDKKMDEGKFERKLTDKINTFSKNEPLYCIGYKIPKIHLTESFSKPVYFTRAIIQNGDFSGAKFQNVDFSGAVLQDSNFSGVIFENADFLAVKFQNISNFSKTVFKNKVNFSESNFDQVDFNSSKLKRAQFIGTKFQKSDFSLATIEDSDFFGAIFEKDVMFIGTEIVSTVFRDTVFKDKANFTGAILNKTDFPVTRFHNLNLDHANLRVVQFIITSFLGNVGFNSSNFEMVNFVKPRFMKDVDFSDSRLNDVSLSGGKIEGKGEFVKTQFLDKVKFLHFEINESDFSNAQFKGKTFFDDVQFKDQNNVVFNVDDLSMVSFKNTDVTKVRFGENVKWAGNDGFTIIDEDTLSKSDDLVELESTIAIYRNLRKNYDYRFRYEEADRFFAKEIELTKKYYENHPQHPKAEKKILVKKLQELQEQCKRLEEQVSRLEKLDKK